MEVGWIRRNMRCKEETCQCVCVVISVEVMNGEGRNEQTDYGKKRRWHTMSKQLSNIQLGDLKAILGPN